MRDVAIKAVVPPPPPKWSSLISKKLLLHEQPSSQDFTLEKDNEGKSPGNEVGYRACVLGLQVPEVLWDKFSCGFDSDE